MTYTTRCGLLAATLCIGISGAALAKKPEHAGKPKHADKHAVAAKHDDGAGAVFFDSARQAQVREYLSRTKGSSCPPGLAKKGNGCQPPGQAKKWQRGERLPADVVYYDPPVDLLRELGRTPEGQKIVRVGTDLLLISVGTGMVIDAIHDLDELF